MAISSATVFEVRTTGAATNGGGFKAGASGTDWTQQDAVKYALSGLTSSGAGNVVLSALAAADWVGNIVQVISGTNFTAGFFEITSVSAGVSFTCSTNQAAAAICTGVGASGVANIGGAYKFGTATDAVFSAGCAAGNTVWVKSGTYTLNTALAFTDSTATTRAAITGYNASRSDNPTGSSRPTINMAGTTNDYGSNTVISNIIFTGTATSPVSSDGSSVWYNNKFINTSPTTGRFAVTCAADDIFINCEMISQAGFGVTGSADMTVFGCYIHDCATCIRQSGTGSATNISDNIIAGAFTNGIQISGAQTGITSIVNNTIYGNNNTGTGVNIATGATGVRLLNNIITGWSVGVNATTANTVGWSNWNTFQNNTTDRTNWLAGTNDVAAAPGFISVAIVSGTAGVVSGSTMTDSGASFANVVDNQDYLDIVSGTGVTTTPGAMLITSHTATSVTVAAAIGGTGTNIVYNVRTGQNFAIGSALQALGFPGLFPGGLTTGYEDIGAAQRKERASTDPGVGNVRSGTAYTINDASLTGTLAVTTTGAKGHLGPANMG